MRLGISGWTEIASIPMCVLTSPRSLLALKGWLLIDLNLMPGQINIELSVDVLLKRRVYV
jgi:hypothetical protein